MEENKCGRETSSSINRDRELMSKIVSKTQQRGELRLAIHTINNSLYDFDINNCTRLFRLHNRSTQAIKQ